MELEKLLEKLPTSIKHKNDFGELKISKFHSNGLFRYIYIVISNGHDKMIRNIGEKTMKKTTKILISVVLVIIAISATLVTANHLLAGDEDELSKEDMKLLDEAYDDADLAFGFYDGSVLINATGELPIEEIVNITVVNPTEHKLHFEGRGIIESYALETFSNIGYFIYHENEWIPAKYCGNIRMAPDSETNISLKIVIDNVASAIKGMNHSIDIRFSIVYWVALEKAPYPISWPILHISATVIT